MKKKQLIAGILTCAMLASFAGCASGTTVSGSGASGASSSGSDAASPAGLVEVTIPSYKTGENVGAVFFEPQVERFNEKYAGKYKINLETVPEDGFKDRLKQLAQQNKLPVLVQGGDKDWITNVVIPNGLAYDLSAWLNEKPAVKGVLLADSLDFCTTEDGKIYSFPLATVRPTGFFYNTQLWNPEGDLSAMSMEEFLAALGEQKIAFSTAENGWVAALILTALVANQDGGLAILQDGTDNLIVDFNQPVFVNAVAQLQALLQNNAAPNSIGAAYPDAANAFMSSQAAIISNGPWMSTDFAAENSANWSNGFDGGNVRASLFPGQVGIATTRNYGEWWISASASPEEIELALAFFEFLYTPEELEAYLLAEGGDAPNLEYSADFTAKQAQTPVLADLAADTTTDTVFAPCILDVIPASVANTEFGKLLPSLADGTYTPEQFCQWMTDKAAEATAQ